MIEGYKKDGTVHSPKVLKKQLEQVIQMAGGEESIVGIL